MNVIVTKNYDESCQHAAEMMAAVVKKQPDAKLGLATGSTPVPIYQKLADMYKAGEVDFSKARTVNLDEYCGLAPEHDQSYRYFMNQNLFDHINIDKANTYVPNGLGDMAKNCAELDAKVMEGGAPALQLLGVGQNGHIGFNEAADQLVAESHVEQLTQSTIAANVRFFTSINEVPTQAITMGIRGIMAAKQVVLVATGASKKDAIQGLLMEGNISTQNPCTILKLHPDVTVVIDEELAALVGYRA